MSIGNRIKNRRKELGMSAEQLADLVNVSPSTIYRYESGDIENMGVEKIVPVAKALNVSESYLMGWPDSLNEVFLTSEIEDAAEVLQELLYKLHSNEEISFKGIKLEGSDRELLIHEIDNAIGIMNIKMFC